MKGNCFTESIESQKRVNSGADLRANIYFYKKHPEGL